VLEVEDVEDVSCAVDDMKVHELFANFGFQRDGVREGEQGFGRIE
jgi:hypothetical protein